MRKNHLKAGASLSEWSRTGSFMNKPELGWIHPDTNLGPDAGICYGVRYIGCLEVKESMKSLDFETRTTIARESINRVAEAAGLKTATKRKKLDRRLAKMLADAPHMQYAGFNVNLTITTESINLMVMESGDTIADHPLHVVSFASGGDVDTLDFVSYVAKDPEHNRACFVLECGGGLAEDVVTTIGQAFELRFKQFLNKKPKAVQIPDPQEKLSFDEERWGDREDYVNDDPESMPPPPDECIIPALPPRPDFDKGEGEMYSTVKEEESSKDVHSYGDSENASNLVDEDLLNGDDGKSEHSSSHTATFDAFDMEPFSVELPPAPQPPVSSDSVRSKRGEKDLRENKETSSESLEPSLEEWYHNEMSRKQAECLLELDGDFLVRKSSNSPGQFVLSGKQMGTFKHLLLVDPEGIVRTRDFIFDSVSHLINYHRQNNLPIITQGSELQLIRPIKTTFSSI